MGFVIRAWLASRVCWPCWCPDLLAAKFGIVPEGSLGFSTLRADFGALFGGVGAIVAEAARIASDGLRAAADVVRVGKLSFHSAALVGGGRACARAFGEPAGWRIRAEVPGEGDFGVACVCQ